MKESLATAELLVAAHPTLAAFKVRREGDELHLAKNGESFARLIPTTKDGQWRLEYFHNLERWECIDFTGALEECLDFLSDNPHYLFWEG